MRIKSEKGKSLNSDLVYRKGKRINPHKTNERLRALQDVKIQKTL